MTLPDNGPDGFAYIKAGHPSFAADSVVQVEYDADLVATYEIDSTGDPVLASRRILADMNGTGPVGCAFDPISGDLLISNYSADNVYRIKGFLAPTCLTDADADGTADCDDGCPADPDKTQPGVCGCGKADTDTDSDGTPDCQEQPPAGQPTDACGCDGGMGGMMMMPMTLLGIGWLRRRAQQRGHK